MRGNDIYVYHIPTNILYSPQVDAHNNIHIANKSYSIDLDDAK